jgi:hypothetical protein
MSQRCQMTVGITYSGKADTITVAQISIRRHYSLE